MGYTILENVLAPKCTDADGIDLENKSHMFLYDRCNYRCKFCYFASYDFNFHGAFEYTTDLEFIAKILQLLPKGKNFKFSGGEPSLNPKIYNELKIVNQLGGTVFFDTNGSNPSLIKKLLDEKLIKVLAVSLKGLSADECKTVANIKKSEFCWENTLKTIEYGCKTLGTKVIVTHVCYNDVSYDEILKFADILDKYEGVFYKVNNLHKTRHLDNTIKRADTDKIISLLKRLIKERPKWNGKVIFVDNDDGITDYDKILFL